MYDATNNPRFCVPLVALIVLTVIALPSLICGQGKTSKAKPSKEMCITFDELPAAESFSEVDRTAITYLILQTLKKHNVKAVGFVVGDQIEGSFDILGDWLNNGHILGNMTYSNQDLHELGIEQFIADIRAGEEALKTMLEGFGQRQQYFRYPFLHYGTDAETKKQVNLYLDAHDYIVVPASVVIEDYLYNLTLEKMGKQPDSSQFDELLNEYVNHVLDEIELMETAAKQILGRSCRHILRLKANRLNAVYLDEMLTAIEDMGYTFITLDRALDDELYQTPEAYFGSRGVSYIYMIQQSDPDFLPAE